MKRETVDHDCKLLHSSSEHFHSGTRDQAVVTAGAGVCSGRVVLKRGLMGEGWDYSAR